MANEPKLTELEARLIREITGMADALVADSWPSIEAVCAERPDALIGALGALTVVNSALQVMLQADRKLAEHNAPSIPPMFVVALIDRVFMATIPPLRELIPESDRDELVARIGVGLGR